MKCGRCGKETIGGMSRCHNCLDKWYEIRKDIYNGLLPIFGKHTKDNHQQFVKEFKRLEKIKHKEIGWL